MANFILKTEHDCLAEHLNNLGILTSNLCLICRIGTLNNDNFMSNMLVCPVIDSLFYVANLSLSSVLEGFLDIIAYPLLLHTALTLPCRVVSLNIVIKF